MTNKTHTHTQQYIHFPPLWKMKNNKKKKFLSQTSAWTNSVFVHAWWCTDFIPYASNLLQMFHKTKRFIVHTGLGLHPPFPSNNNKRVTKKVHYKSIFLFISIIYQFKFWRAFFFFNLFSKRDWFLSSWSWTKPLLK